MLFSSLTEKKTECGRGSNYPELPKVMAGNQVFPSSLWIIPSFCMPVTKAPRRVKEWKELVMLC